MEKYNRKNIWIFVKAILIVIIIIILKFIAHVFDLEFLTINNLFSGIIAANVFLMGFLLSGVLSDYKESEKIPGEIASSINNIYSELFCLYHDKKIFRSKDSLIYCQELTNSILLWFHRKERTTLYNCKNQVFEFTLCGNRK